MIVAGGVASRSGFHPSTADLDREKREYRQQIDSRD